MKRIRSNITTQSLSIVWCICLFLGAAAACVYYHTLPLFGTGIEGVYRSPFRILVPTILPFLLSALIIYLSGPELMLTLCGVKSFIHAFSCCFLMLAYGHGFWLAQLLYTFTNAISLPFLYLYWHRIVSGLQNNVVSENIIFFSLFLFIGGIDYFIVSPFAAGL